MFIESRNLKTKNSAIHHDSCSVVADESGNDFRHYELGEIGSSLEFAIDTYGDIAGEEYDPDLNPIAWQEECVDEFKCDNIKIMPCAIKSGWVSL